MVRLLLIVATVLCVPALLAAVDGPAVYPGRSQLGMNLSPPSFFSSNWVYGNLMHQAQHTSGEWRAFHGARENGFPYPRGGFIVDPPGMAAVVDTGNGLVIRQRDRRTPLAEEAGIGLEVWMPGAIRDQLFHPLYLERLQPFRVIRFMDWLRTNSAGMVTWGDLQRRTRVPLWHMLELANTLQADPWFCMPHDADDDLVRQFATTARQRLWSGATVYVEWSNEPWNAMFPAADWLRINSDGEVLGHAYVKLWAERIENVSRIWRDVWGEEADRLVVVAGSQAAWPDVTRRLLRELDPDAYDAVAIAAYFSNWRQNEALKEAHGAGLLDADRMLELVEEALPQFRQWYVEHARHARGVNKPLIAYEAGQHLHFPNQPWDTIAREAQRRPRMRELYRKNHANWFAALREAEMPRELIERSVVVYFNDVGHRSVHGSWGHLEFQNQPIDQAPKYQALLDIAAEGPAGY